MSLVVLVHLMKADGSGFDRARWLVMPGSAVMPGGTALGSDAFRHTAG
ncbi:MAG TPA: hypothetical protein VGP57_16310 [Actinoplanes sp.]|nr:hypothetical protein [Actinoplanes sp.]